MLSHPATETLSAYLDSELEVRSSERVEVHLGECVSCRRRLEGLRRVVRELHRVPGPELPPRLLSPALPMLRDLEAEPRTLADRLTARAVSRRVLQSPVWLSFAVVLALVTIVFFYSSAVSEPRGRLRLIFGATDPGPAPSAPARLAGGRRFSLEGSYWLQEGIAADVAASLPPLAEAEALELVTQQPWVRDLLSSGAGVVFEIDGRYLRIAAPIDLNRGAS